MSSLSARATVSDAVGSIHARTFSGYLHVRKPRISPRSRWAATRLSSTLRLRPKGVRRSQARLPVLNTADLRSSGYATDMMESAIEMSFKSAGATDSPVVAPAQAPKSAGRATSTGSVQASLFTECAGDKPIAAAVGVELALPELAVVDRQVRVPHGSSARSSRQRGGPVFGWGRRSRGGQRQTLDGEL